MIMKITMMTAMVMVMLTTTMGRFTVESGSGGGTVRMEAKAEIKEGEEITVASSAPS